MRGADTLADVIESHVPAGAPAQPFEQQPDQICPTQAYPLDELRSLMATIDTACEDLFAAAPYAGDQATGCSIDAFVDEVVAALRSLQSEADDLHRVMSIAQQRNRSRDGGRSS